MHDLDMHAKRERQQILKAKFLLWSLQILWLVTAHSPRTIKIGAAAWLCDIPPDKPGQKRVGGRRKEEEEEAATRKTTQGVDSGLSVAHSPRIHTHT